MFWGIVLKANKKYSQKAVKSFHVSQAVLDHTSSSGGPNQLYVTHENSKYLIATLENNKCQQVALDLNFAAGQEVSFQSLGNGCIHLTGYLTELPENVDSDDYSDEEDEVSENEIQQFLKKNGITEKSKSKKGLDKANAKSKNEDDEENEDSDENDSDSMGDLEMDEDAEDDSDEDDEVQEEDSEDDDSDEEEVQQPKAKQIKLDKAANKQQNGVAKKDEHSKKDKKNKKEKKQANMENQQQNGGEKTLAGGVKIHDIIVGTGPEVKSGKKVHVYYEGRLKQNNKVFDSVKQGSGFKFNVGRGDVIKGWDVGVVGMKVGGKRRITCPPHMAYGAKGMPPQIPPNSTLVFEVEIKGV